MKSPADYIFKPLTGYYQDEYYSWVSGEDVAVLGEDTEKIYSYYETEWMFRNQNYQLFAPEVDQEYIDIYKTWDDEAIASNVLGFSFNNENVKEFETMIKEVTGKILAPIRSGFVDFDTEYPKVLKNILQKYNVNMMSF